MSHRIWIIILALVLVTGWSTAPESSEKDTPLTDVQFVPVGTDADVSAEDQKQIKGSAKKGKYYFKKSCKECHGSGDDGGEITPISKTIKQWQRFFRKGVHYKTDTESGAAVIDSLGTPLKLLHIQTFLVAHAADSDQPETCK